MYFISLHSVPTQRKMSMQRHVRVDYVRGAPKNDADWLHPQIDFVDIFKTVKIFNLGHS